MKKLYILLFIAVTSFSLTNAQFTKVGGGLGFTTGYPFHQMDWDYNKSGNLNIFVKGIYEISLPLHISPSFTFFLPHVWKSASINSESKITVSTMMFDVNAHYVFNSLDQFEFYGLAGIDILIANKKDVMTITGSVPFTETLKEHDNAIGLNLGLGTYMKLTDQLDLSVEAKYLVSKYHQFMLSAGVLLNIDWLKKNENPGL